MGTYVYTARATGRVKALVDGHYHWIFPAKFEYKINLFDTDENARFAEKALRTAARVERHKDWEGYVFWNAEVYRNASAFFSDYADPGELCETVYDMYGSTLDI